MEIVILEGGKYQLILDQSNGKFSFYANRYGAKHWRNDLVGDGMILAMFYRIQELEQKLNSVQIVAENIEDILDNDYCDDVSDLKQTCRELLEVCK